MSKELYVKVGTEKDCSRIRRVLPKNVTFIGRTSDEDVLIVVFDDEGRLFDADLYWEKDIILEDAKEVASLEELIEILKAGL